MDNESDRGARAVVPPEVGMTRWERSRLWIGGTICALIFGRACFFVAAKVYLVGALDRYDLAVVAIGLVALILTWSYARKLFAKEEA